MTKLHNINTNVLDRNTKNEVYRTPAYAYTPLLDYRPDWFKGIGFDPSSGDGRMIGEIINRGNTHAHYVNDIREEERELLNNNVPTTNISIKDYLNWEAPPEADFLITNPPFSLSVNFVEKARTHINGPICILQSVSWQGTAKRSRWLKTSGLAFVLNLAKRPRWEVDTGTAHSNIWDFAWFIFLPNHTALPQMDWLF
jgi:hypothetical protein